MKLKYLVLFVFASIFFSGCTLGTVITNYQWKNASPEAKKKVEEYYDMQCRADPTTSTQEKLKDGYGSLYIYAYGCTYCKYFMFPDKDGFGLVPESSQPDIAERKIYINDELIANLHVWEYTILYLKAGKYRLFYDRGNISTDVEVIDGEPTLFYPVGERRALVLHGRDNLTGFYDSLPRYITKPFYVKLPENEKYLKDTEEYLGLSNCYHTSKRWKVVK